jgi:hypothetical protein
MIVDNKYCCIGIDPQQTLLGVTVLNSGGSMTQCFTYWFKKKTSFKTSGDWEVYICTECIGIAAAIKTKLGDEMEGNGVYVAIEQQRSRVNSIIEAALTTAFLAEGCKVMVPHPRAWKAGINMKQGGSNKENKRHSEEKYGEKLRSFYKNNKVSLPDRIHDLCDSMGIAEYLYLRISDNVRNIQ